jgi:hypothetical protein
LKKVGRHKGVTPAGVSQFVTVTSNATGQDLYEVFGWRTDCALVADVVVIHSRQWKMQIRLRGIAE